MKIDEIKELMKEMAGSGIAELQYEEGGVKLHLCTKDAPVRETLCQTQQAADGSVLLPGAGAGASAGESAGNGASKATGTASAAGQSGAGSSAAAQAEGNVVKSPLVGTFYVSPSPEKPAYVKVGDHVKKGQVIGIIEAMKLMNEIESEFEGTVAEILVGNEQVVEYGQPLVRIV